MEPTVTNVESEQSKPRLTTAPAIFGLAFLALAAPPASGQPDLVFRGDFEAVPPTASGYYLNDTGVTACVDQQSAGLDCADTTDFPGQDAEHGRDLTANDDADAHAGFVFTKLDNNGQPLLDQSSSYGDQPWSCVQDEVTGLTWEVKTSDGGLQARGWSYSWLDHDRIGTNISGLPNDGRCIDNDNCDTEKYIASINAAALCGYQDWRLPQRGELLSIVDYQAPPAPPPPGFPNSASPFIDPGYFPNTSFTLPYWTATSAGSGILRRTVSFKDGLSGSKPMDESLPVRLVRGGSE